MLAIAKNLEEIQQAKLKNEQIEFRNGRSTTYQILMFAQDLANAELSRLKAVYDILLIDIQLGLFQEERV
jgi:outer membrane protein TolC